MSAISKRIRRVRAKLRNARFKVWWRRDWLKPNLDSPSPMTEEQVREFEERHRVVLPEDYRKFITTVGTGGAGPHQGLMSIQAWRGADGESDGFLSRPFPFLPDHRLSRSEDVEAKGANWAAELGVDLDNLHQGAVPLAVGLGGHCSYLVVSGAARGKAVIVTEKCRRSPRFCGDADFLSWYERWLDYLLAGGDWCWLTEDVMLGTESELLEILSDESSVRRADAVRALAVRSSITEASVDALVSALESGEPELRSCSGRALAAHGRLACEHRRILAGDSEESVRRVATFRCGASEGDEWHDIARSQLRDSSADVVAAALSSLEEAGALRWEDVHHLLSSTDSQVVYDAVDRLGGLAEPEARVFLLEALQNEDPLIRHRAIDAFDRQCTRPPVDLVLKLLICETDDYVMAKLLHVVEDSRDKTAVPTLVSLLSDSRARVRHQAACAIGRLGSMSAIEALEELLADETNPYECVGEDGEMHRVSGCRVCDAASDAIRAIRRRCSWRFWERKSS